VGHRKVTFPWIIGHELAGTVVEKGSDFRASWEEGDRVAVGPMAYCGTCEFCLSARYELCTGYREIAQHWPGGFAEYIAIPRNCVELGSIFPIPEGLDPAFAAITEPIASCIHAQEKGQIGLGDTLAIIGAGPVGCIHAALARARGADRIIIADIDAGRLELGESFEPDETVNAAEKPLVDELLRLTHGRGADVVITATPAPVAVVQAVEMAKKGGRILLFGGLPKQDSKPGVDMNVVHYNALHLMGTTIFAPRHQRMALQMVASGRIPAEKLVTHRFPLSDFPKGAELALDGKVLKAVFFP
jgi:L-iditol 2-dehydrogenase